MLKFVEDNKADFLESMKRAIELKSLTCQEKDYADFYFDFFKVLGVEETFIDGTGNIVAVLRGEGTGPNILMNGHLDEVPEGNLDAWLPYKPYEPTVEGDDLIGRGISDMKGATVAMAYAFKAVVERVISTGKKLSGDLIFLGVVQEEPAEMFGMEYFFEHTMKDHDLKVDCMITGESTSGRINLGGRGKVELVVRTYGKIAHSSQPKLGVNALEHMVPVLHDIFKLKGIELKDDVRFGETSITVTNCTVSPGGTISCVPDFCEISIDRRYTTDQTLDDLMDEFKAIFEEVKKEYPDLNATVEPRYYEETSYTGYTNRVKKFHPPWLTDENNVFAVAAFDALRDLGEEPEVGYYIFGTDGSYTGNIMGLPTIGYSGGEEKWAHQPKERVSIKAMNKTMEVYIAMLCRIYGLELSIFD